MFALTLVLVPLVASGLAWAVPRAGRRWLFLSVAVLLAGLSAYLASRVLQNGTLGTSGEWIRVDALGAWMIAAIAAAAWPVLVYVSRHAVRHGNARSFDSWLMVLLAAMYLVVITGNLGLMWVAIEATTVSSTLLVAQYGTRPALEAAWKYVLICSAGIIFALLGTMIFYYAGTLAGSHGMGWSSLVGVGSRLDPALVRMAFVFVLVGYGAKAGLAPLHHWLPDAHSQAPAPVSALLSGILLGCATYAVARFLTLTNMAGDGAFAQVVLIGMGLLSLFVAAGFLVVQKDLKRMLAYSSVEHTGIIFVALGFGGLAGVSAALLHLLNHALVKPALFLVAGEVSDAYGTRQIGRVRGLMARLPGLGVLFLALLAAVAGLPPFGLFLSEWLVLKSGMALGWVLPSMVAALLAIAFAGLMYHAARMVLGPPGGRSLDVPEKPISWVVPLPFLLVLLTGLVLPGPMLDALEKAATVVLQGVVLK